MFCVNESVLLNTSYKFIWGSFSSGGNRGKKKVTTERDERSPGLGVFPASVSQAAVGRMVLMRRWLFTASPEFMSLWKILLQRVLSAGKIDLKEGNGSYKEHCLLPVTNYVCKNDGQAHCKSTNRFCRKSKAGLKSARELAFNRGVCTKCAPSPLVVMLWVIIILYFSLVFHHYALNYIIQCKMHAIMNDKITYYNVQSTQTLTHCPVL